MEYAINKLAQLAGISTRTLRYYDQIDLLRPARISNGYRVYGQAEVDLLQQIMFYRELDLPLDEIKRIVTAPDYDAASALAGHLQALRARQRQLETLIATVEQTIAARKGEIEMSDKEKFVGFKQQLIDDNEAKYGREVREKYGDDVVERSNAQLMNMTEEQHRQVEQLSEQIAAGLRQALAEGDPASGAAQQVCELHKQWLCFFWPDYSKEAHLGLGQMYVEDARFKAYYDAIAPGCAEFLRDALTVYCG